MCRLANTFRMGCMLPSGGSSNDPLEIEYSYNMVLIYTNTNKILYHTSVISSHATTGRIMLEGIRLKLVDLGIIFLWVNKLKEIYWMIQNVHTL